MKNKKFGDRKDGRLLRDLDGMHFIMPIIYPNRCDNEAYISERIDLTGAEEWLKEKNAAPDKPGYSVFDLIVTAILKTVTLRPKMNRFIANCNTYERNEVSASFVIKKEFKDDGGEGLAFIHSRGEHTVDDIHNMIRGEMDRYRSGSSGSTEDAMEFFNHLPRFLGKFLVRLIMILDRHGKVPQSLISEDPYYSSVVLTNLGSIRLRSGYHHLTNWGTNSIFLSIGEKKKRPFYDRNGEMSIRESIDIGFTIDERLADGYYYSRTIRLFKRLMEHPELLEAPLSQAVEGF